MSKKVLIRKQAGGVQQFQQIGGRGGPSFMDLARRVRDPTASGWQKVIAGLGMAGKTAAGIGAANQTLQQMHGGNAFAPLNLGYTYQGLDPTTGMQATVTPGEQQDAEIRERLQTGATQDVRAATDMGIDLREAARGNVRLPPPAGLATPPTSGVPPTHPGFVPASQPAAQPAQPAAQPAQPAAQPAQPAAQPAPAQAASREPLHPLGPEYNTGGARGPAAQPTNTAAASVLHNLGIETPALSNELIQATANTSVPTAAPATAAPAIPNPGGFPVDGQNAQKQNTFHDYSSYASGTGPNPPPVPSTPAPGYVPPYQYDPNTQLSFSNIPGTPGNVNPQPSRVNEENMTIDGVPYFTPTAFQLALQRKGLAKSFASHVLDQFGDMLHKADPHVAGLLAFRVYMDKVMR